MIETSSLKMKEISFWVWLVGWMDTKGRRGRPERTMKEVLQVKLNLFWKIIFIKFSLSPVSWHRNSVTRDEIICK